MAKETTFLLGNGIGRAIDNNYFSLETGIQKSLDELPNSERDVIELLFDSNYSESALENHHSIANSCHNLINLEDKHSLLYLNDNGKNFLRSFYNFIYLAAKYFWEYPVEKIPAVFTEFINRFSDYIRGRKSNVANLNYDKLIYDPFVDGNILKGGYDGVLIDGILTRTGVFEAENFLHKNKNNLGYYLHLHGSPSIFFENNGVRKIHHKDKLPNSFHENNRMHNTIVLSHANLKSDLIFGNCLLATYFTVFRYALADSSTLCLIGYGGEDVHINKEIKQWIYEKVVNKVYDNHIYIIDYSRSKISKEEWVRKLYPNFKYEKLSIDNHIKLHYQPMDNILEFDFQIQ